MALIHVLDEKTINKIAAGEVVERPASVIKELVENAMDASATSIDIEIVEGGMRYMRVSDNGSGMTEEDARLSILRHATSKIRDVEDLFSIASLGFRGEALASISSVSRFRMLTRRKDTEFATRVVMEGGQLLECGPYGGGYGTTVEVEDLFFNTPARKKFLKTERTETNRIQDMVGKLALSHPEIAFKLVSNGKVSLLTPGTGNLIETIGALYGFQVANDVFPVFYEGDGIVVEGAVGKPSLIRSSRQWQVFIINDRVITDRVIMKALDTAYHALIPKGGYPFALLRLTLPPEDIDINVHPRKSEVKFSNEKIVYSTVYRGVLRAIESASGEVNNVVTDVHLHTPVKQVAPVVENREMTKHLLEEIKSGTYTFSREKEPVQEVLEGVFEIPSTVCRETNDTYEIEKDRENIEKAFSNHGIEPMGQVADCYIIAKKENDLFIIDQHAAHERIRYDALCYSAKEIPSQESLIPICFSVTPEEMDLIEVQESLLRTLGYYVVQIGPEEVKIDAFPVDFKASKAEEVLRYIFSLLLDGKVPDGAYIRHEMLAFASCRGAIKAGHVLTLHQMRVLIDTLFTTEKPYVCPHGRPTILRLTTAELAKLFLRA